MVSEAGLGKYLYEALGGNVIVVDVAKKPFRNISKDFAVNRAKRDKPLYVTSAGIKTDTAKRLVAAMSGQFRLPEILKLADQVCRGQAVNANKSVRTESLSLLS